MVVILQNPKDAAVRDAGGLLAAKLVDLRMGDPNPMRQTVETLQAEPKRLVPAMLVLVNMVAQYAEQTPPKLEGLIDYLIREIAKD